MIILVTTIIMMKLHYLVVNDLTKEKQRDREQNRNKIYYKISKKVF